MKLLAIAGSLRENSYNRQLAEAAGALMREKHPEVGYGILRWEDVPFMNQDIEHPEPAPVAKQTACGCSAPSTTTRSPDR